MLVVKESAIKLAQLLILTPVLGAILAFFFRKTPAKLHAWCLAVVSLELVVVLVLSREAVANVTNTLALLIVFAGCMAILARYVANDPPFDLLETLMLLGLGLGNLWSSIPIALLFLAAILMLLILMQRRLGGHSDPETRWVSALYGLALLLLAILPFLSGDMAVVLLVLVYATLLPVFPLHGALLCLLKRLPGTQAAFLSLFLPALGLNGLLPLLPLLPPELKTVFQVFAIVGLLLGGLRSLVQQELNALLAQVSLVFWGVLWWHLADSNELSAAALSFLSAAGLALCALFLLSHALTARYGDLLIAQFSGLAGKMPRFAVMFVLFCTASMGLPLFGLFTGFMALSFSVSTLSWGLFFSLLAWLILSWRFPTLLQSLLFGKAKPQWHYQDINAREILALSLILLILFLLGIVPDRLLGIETLAKLSLSGIGLS